MATFPDGILDKESITEVKCPFRFREEVFEECLENKTDYIVYFKNGNIIINEKRDYYDQIQGQLLFTKRDKCFLIIYGTKYCLQVCINKNPQWASNIGILENFYFTKYSFRVRIF